MRFQHFGEHARFTGQAAGMAGDRRAHTLAAADLQHDHRLAHVGGAVERGDIAIGIAHAFGERRDHLGVRIVDGEFDVARGVVHRFVAGRHDEAEAESAQVREQARGDRAALRDQRDVADQRLRIAHFLLEGGAARRRIEHAHAVWPAQRHARFAADAGDLALHRLAFVADLGKPAVVDDSGTRAMLGRGPEVLQDAVAADAERDDVGRLRQLLQSLHSSCGPATDVYFGLIG